MTRFALGMRGPTLYERVGSVAGVANSESNVGTTLARLDVDKDGLFTTIDATVLARYMAGFRNAALVRGLSIENNVAPPNAASITSYIEGGCVLSTPSFTSKQAAARLLQQGTWGASNAEITATSNLTPDAWITDQFTKPRSLYTPYAETLIAQNKVAGNPRCNQLDSGCPWAVHGPMFYKMALEGQDQLRQRVTNALLQTLVVSIGNNVLLDSGTGVASYLDTISKRVFEDPSAEVGVDGVSRTTGSFRKLLRDITLHPAMGVYLDMLGSSFEVPNENFARELLQLFSIGTVMLNNDGTAKLDGAGKPIATYDEPAVQGFAKAFTGWHFANQPMSDEPWLFYWPIARWTEPMTPWTGRRCPQDGRWPQGTTDATCPAGSPTGCWCKVTGTHAALSYPPPHNTDSKSLLQYANAPFATLPAGQSAEQDLEQAIDNVFNHPNVGPFIVRQLIQRMVTSNPTPAYVNDIANVFNNNGSNQRGDIKSVVRAILLHSEARSATAAAQISFGKLREPIIKFLQLHRAFGATASSGYYDIWDIGGVENVGQSPLKAPSVFNYYHPDFAPSGAMTYGALPLQGPEFEIASTSSVAGFADFVKWGVIGGFNYPDIKAGDSDEVVTFKRARHIAPNHAPYLSGATPLADNPTALVNDLDLLLTANNLKPGFKANLIAMAGGITRSDINEQRQQRLAAVLWQIIQSADYAIQR